MPWKKQTGVVNAQGVIDMGPILSVSTLVLFTFNTRTHTPQSRQSDFELLDNPL